MAFDTDKQLRPHPLAIVLRWSPIASALIGLFVLVGACAQTGSPQPQGGAVEPNVLVILVDDLGYSDIGVFGGEIDTSNLDSLALSGTRFTDFHASPTCSPTRAMLMTGRDNHAVGLGTMAEFLPPNAPRAPGYEGYLSADAKTIAEVFQVAGYRTAMAGKWHLGMEDGQTPDARGFDRSYVLLDGAARHFGLSDEDSFADLGVKGGYREDGQVVQLPPGSYAGDVYSDHIIEYIGEAWRAGRPFFAYLAFTEPHWPLQAPQDLIEKYRGRYDDGPQALRQSRMQKMVELGLIDPDMVAHELAVSPVWENMTEEQRQHSARSMEVYAAMIERIDQNVGRIVDYLQQTDQFDSTIIVFLSDNGADGVSTETLLTGMRPTDDQISMIDNSLDNLGRPNSYIAYGAAWAEASSGPLNRHKIYTTEGGTRVPAFIAGPGIADGRISSSFLHVSDVLPTLVELTGIAANYENASDPPDGKSFAEILLGGEAEIHKGEAVGWELFLGRAIRLDDWKAVMLPPKNNAFQFGASAAQWMLFDLSDDVGETNDLSDSHPEKLEDLVGAWHAYAKENGVVIPYEDGAN